MSDRKITKFPHRVYTNLTFFESWKPADRPEIPAPKIKTSTLLSDILESLCLLKDLDKILLLFENVHKFPKNCRNNFVNKSRNLRVMTTRTLCSRNFQNVKLRLDFFEIWSFYCNSDFTWNQILVNSNGPKMSFLAIL